MDIDGPSRVVMWLHSDGEMHWRVYQPKDGDGIIEEGN